MGGRPSGGLKHGAGALSRSLEKRDREVKREQLIRGQAGRRRDVGEEWCFPGCGREQWLGTQHGQRRGGRQRRFARTMPQKECHSRCGGRHPRQGPAPWKMDRLFGWPSCPGGSRGADAGRFRQRCALLRPQPGKTLLQIVVGVIHGCRRGRTRREISRLRAWRPPPPARWRWLRVSAVPEGAFFPGRSAGAPNRRPLP